eukprot:5661885-Amphidinium_carterae.1
MVILRAYEPAGRDGADPAGLRGRVYRFNPVPPNLRELIQQGARMARAADRNVDAVAAPAAAAPVVARLAAIALGYLDKVRESEGKQGSGSIAKLTYEEQSILSGATRLVTNLMVAPMLL